MTGTDNAGRDASARETDSGSSAGLPRDDADTDAERRMILARLGKMAALTPPTIVTLLMSTRASAASLPPPDPPPPPPPDPHL